MIALAEGVGWTRSPVPGSLKHINLWLLDDGDGVALVDTGLDIAAGARGLGGPVRRAARRARRSPG